MSSRSTYVCASNLELELHHVMVFIIIQKVYHPKTAQ